MKTLRFFLLLLLIPVSMPVWAAEKVSSDEPPPTPKIDVYLARTDAKFDRGMINFAGGWTEFIRQPAEAYKDKGQGNAFWRVTKGTAKGLVFGITDVVGGFVNAITAPVPQFEIPLPQGGMKPSNLTGGDAEQAVKNTKEWEKQRDGGEKPAVSEA